MIRSLFYSEVYSRNINLVLLLVRLIVGAFMLTHGWGKFLKLIGDGTITFADPLGLGETTSLVLTVFAEVFCSILIILGLTPRFATFPSLLTLLLVAFFTNAKNL